MNKEVKKPSKRENRLNESKVLSVTINKFNLFCKLAEERGQVGLDALCLFMFYMKTVTIQGTYSIWSTNTFAEVGLGISNGRISKAKDLLQELGLISIKKTRNGNRNGKSYVIVHANVNSTKIVADVPSSDFDTMGFDEPQNEEPQVSYPQVSQTSNSEANALSTNINTLSTNLNSLSRKENALPMNEMLWEKPITLQPISPKGLSSREEEETIPSYYIYNKNTENDTNLPSYSSNSENAFFKRFLSIYNSDFEVQYTESYEEMQENLDLHVSRYPQFNYDTHIPMDEHLLHCYLAEVDNGVQELHTKEHNDKMNNLTYDKFISGNSHQYSKQHLDKLLEILYFDSQDARSFNCNNKYGAIQNMFAEIIGLSNMNDVLGRIVYMVNRDGKKKNLNYIYKAFKSEADFEDATIRSIKDEEMFVANRDKLKASGTPDVYQEV